MHKRTIRELQDRYERIPETKTDVYVEGVFDKYLLDWFFAQVGNKLNKVYTIDSVEVPDELIDSYSLNRRSNKHKIIVLANELKKSLADSAKLISFIVDKDMDDYIARPDSFDTTLILSTDYVSMDLYLITPDALSKYLSFYGVCSATASDAATKGVFALTRDLFAARLALAKLASSVGLINYDKYLSKCPINTVSIDLQTLLQRSLIAAGAVEIESSLMRCLQDWKDRFRQDGVDARTCSHGRDTFEVLRWIASSGNSKPLVSKAEGVRAAFLMAMSASHLAAYPLFQKFVPQP